MKNFNFEIKRKGLQWQLLSRFFLILAVLFLVMGISQYLSMREYLLGNKASVLQLRFHNIDLRALGHINTRKEIESNMPAIIDKLVNMNMSAAVIDKSGNLISTLGKRETMDHRGHKDHNEDPDNDFDIDKPQSIAIPTLSKEDYIKILNTSGNLERTYNLVRDKNNLLQIVAWRKIGDINGPSGLIQLSSPVDDVQNILLSQIYMYLAGLILILILGYFIGGIVFKRTLNPLYNMTKTVEKISVGELHTRLPENNGLLEIDKLSESFNKMLTSIHGFVEVLLRGAARNEEQLNSALKSILLESERLNKLVQDLLMITRLDQKLPLEMHLENISKVIEEVFPQLKILAGERDLSLNLKDIMVNINKDQIKQVIFNLAQNAIQHTDKNTGSIIISVDIQQTALEEFAVIRIADNGTGIPKEHIDKIFDRFFRSEYHRSREHGGYGLGLSIVKSIVDAHGGKITVESTLGIGTAFSVHLPIAH